MTDLYVSKYEMAAIKAIDIREVERCVNLALEDGRRTALCSLQLSGAGLHIATCLQNFERDLANYAKAKAATKRSETWSRAWSSGRDLVHAVETMKRRVLEQEVETQLFQIYDQIAPPYKFLERIEVRVGYQWRTSVDSPWTFGAITFFHDVNTGPDYSLQRTARKLSPARLQAQRQDALSKYWNNLRWLALHSVREFFRCGGDGLAIPTQFEAKANEPVRHLNNASCIFWNKSDLNPKSAPNELAEVQFEGQSDEYSAEGRLKIGSGVKHPKFGDGIVLHIYRDLVTIDFGEKGAKRVLANFLEPSSSLAP